MPKGSCRRGHAAAMVILFGDRGRKRRAEEVVLWCLLRLSHPVSRFLVSGIYVSANVQCLSPVSALSRSGSDSPITLVFIPFIVTLFSRVA